jgi:hypothetical protein
VHALVPARPGVTPCVACVAAGGAEAALPALRCSALAAAATLCRQLRHGLAPHLVDIVPLACHLLAHDPVR